MPLTGGAFSAAFDSAFARSRDGTIGQLTRLGCGGFARPFNPDFTGKVSASTGPHNPGEITRLGLCGFSAGLYGSFAGKAEAEVPALIIDKGPLLINPGQTGRLGH